MRFDENTLQKLTAVYGDMLWLTSRPHNSPARVRAWYTHVWAQAVAPSVRVFSGQVSRAALDPSVNLVLEHPNRLAFSLTALLKEHHFKGIYAPDDFIDLMDKTERVHITTSDENRRIKNHAGDYAAAGVELVDWQTIPESRRTAFYEQCLKGHVANANDFAQKSGD